MATTHQNSDIASVSIVEDCLEKGLSKSTHFSKSQANSWDIDIEVLNIPPGEFPEEVIFEKHTIGINLGRAHAIEQVIDGHYSKPFVPTGGIGIFPYQLPIKSQWDSNLNHLYLHLKPELLTRHAQELFEEDSVELITSASTIEDLLIQQLALAVKREFTQNAETRSQIYVQSMADALAVHLLHHYSAKSQPPTIHAGGLSPQNLKLAKEYVNDNLETKLDLDELSQLTRLSRYHFSRAFKKTMGIAPYQYITKQRVKRAKQLLQKGELSIADIAVTCGFAHQSHLNRHFKRLTGLTPKAFLKSETR